MANPILWAACALALITGLGLVFHNGLSHMVQAWGSEEYSHGYLIPIICALLIWQRIPELQNIDRTGSWFGFVLVGVAFIVALMGELATLYTIVEYAFLMTIFGLVLACVGIQGMRRLWAPLAYLIFMVPLPTFLYRGLSAKMQLISSELGVAVIRVLGIPVFLQGNVIDLGIYQLQVVEACNGLRYLFPLMSFGFLCAYLYRGPFWQKAVIFLSAAPWTIFLNSFRIGVTGVLVNYGGIAMAEGFLHDFEGWFIFMAGVALLFLEILLLARLAGIRGSLHDLINLDFPGLEAVSNTVKGWSVPRAFMASVLLVLVTAAGTILIPERQEIIPDHKSLAQYPMKVGEWRGHEGHIEQKYLDILKLDEYVMADYRRPQDNGRVNFYVAFYESQSKGASVHSPRSCIPGGGWEISDLSEVSVDGIDANGHPLNVNRVVIQRGSAKQLVYYWFDQRGRQMTNEYLVKWMIFWDALTRNRTDGALVRVTTMVPPGEDLATADQRLSDFLREIYPTVSTFVPD